MVNAACQHYKKNNIFQNNKSCHQQSVVNKITSILASLTCPFVPFLFFFLDPFTSLRERKLSLLTTGKIQRFVAPGRSKMISLQDSPCLYGWYSCLFIACVLVFFLSLPFSFIFFLCLSTYSTSYT